MQTVCLRHFFCNGVIESIVTISSTEKPLIDSIGKLLGYISKVIGCTRTPTLMFALATTIVTVAFIFVTVLITVFVGIIGLVTFLALVGLFTLIGFVGLVALFVTLVRAVRAVLVGVRVALPLIATVLILVLSRTVRTLWILIGVLIFSLTFRWVVS